MNATVYLKGDLDLRTTHDRLEQLGRGEWFRWGGTLAVTLALTVGVLGLSVPVVPEELMDRPQLEVAVRGLLALVLLFDIFVIHQQYLITKLRRQLKSQLGLITALDLIKHPQTDDHAEPEPAQNGLVSVERRRRVRCHFDEQLKVRMINRHHRESTVQGRIRDITEHGLGAVIPAALEPGDIITVEFTADNCPLAVQATVRYRRGFRYGLEFVSLTERDARALREIRKSNPVS